jgi:hypothetical protein
MYLGIGYKLSINGEIIRELLKVGEPIIYKTDSDLVDIVIKSNHWGVSSPDERCELKLKLSKNTHILIKANFTGYGAEVIGAKILLNERYG